MPDSERSDVAAPEPSLSLERPLYESNFIRIAKNGMGDPENVYCHGMGWFNNALYIGTTRNTLCSAVPYNRAKWLQVWPIQTPEMIWDMDWRSQIWRFDPQTCEFRNVYLSPMVMGSRGFEVALVSGIRDMVPFKGKSDSQTSLYAVAWGSHMGPGPQILRSGDGVSFESTPLDASVLFGGATKGLRPLVALGDKLFVANVGTVSNSDRDQRGGGVFVSSDPAAGEWELANTDSFGDRRNVTIFEMCTWNGYVYAGTMNPYTGFELWKTDAVGKPPFRWQRVLSHGAYRGPLNELAISLCPFRGALYVGTAIYNCGYDRIYHVGPGSPELIRVYPDDTWDLVVGDPRESPEGLRVPTSGLGPGFNNFMTGYVWRVCAHEGWLYASATVWTPWMTFSDPPGGGEHLRRLFDEYLHDDEYMANNGGFDLWRSRDGDHWTPVCRNGLGNRYNVGARTLTSTPYGLFVGTCNQFAPRVAKRRAAGWRYEPNEHGGAEVFWGTHAAPPKPITFSPLEPPPRWLSSPQPSPPLSPRAETLVDEFYGPSGWRHIGYWAVGTQGAQDACDNLMEELYAFTRPDVTLTQPSHPTPERFQEWIDSRPSRPWDTCPALQATLPIAESVVDVGCGLGESTNYLTKYFAPEGIRGITSDRRELRTCRRRFPALVFERSKLPRIELEDNSIDKVFCVEGLSTHGQREVLLSEILRILRPGGQFVAADLTRFATSNVSAPDVDYDGMMRGLGFLEVKVVDATKHGPLRFQESLRTFFDEKAITPAMRRETLTKLPGGGAPIARYVLLSAHKGSAP